MSDYEFSHEDYEVISEKTQKYSSTKVKSYGHGDNKSVDSTIKHHSDQELWIKEINSNNEKKLNLKKENNIDARPGHNIRIITNNLFQKREIIINRSTNQEFLTNNYEQSKVSSSIYFSLWLTAPMIGACFDSLIIPGAFLFIYAFVILSIPFSILFHGKKAFADMALFIKGKYKYHNVIISGMRKYYIAIIAIHSYYLYYIFASDLYYYSFHNPIEHFILIFALCNLARIERNKVVVQYLQALRSYVNSTLR